MMSLALILSVSALVRTLVPTVSPRLQSAVTNSAMGGLIGFGDIFGREHCQIDVGIWEHFSATVTAECGDRAGGGDFGKSGAVFHELVDNGRVAPQIKTDLGVRCKVLGKLFSKVDVRFDGKVAFGRHDASSQNA